ncbi:MAG: HAD family hydrolase [Bacteroidales bacterium]
MKDLKVVLFDMDGVLFDSMKNHTASWFQTMNEWNISCSRDEFYLHEGRTGAGTTRLLFNRELKRDPSEEEIRAVYEMKTKYFNELPLAQPMPGALELLRKIRAQGIEVCVVTGSAQQSLLSRLDSAFPGIFDAKHIICARDVKKGKPDPEPYLKGLELMGVKAEEAIVVENAPMGVQSAKAAGIYTVTVNTGPLDESLFYDLGTDKLYPGMQDLCDNWSNLYAELVHE